MSFVAVSKIVFRRLLPRSSRQTLSSLPLRRSVTATATAAASTISTAMATTPSKRGWDYTYEPFEVNSRFFPRRTDDVRVIDSVFDIPEEVQEEYDALVHQFAAEVCDSMKVDEVPDGFDLAHDTAVPDALKKKYVQEFDNFLKKHNLSPQLTQQEKLVYKNEKAFQADLQAIALEIRKGFKLPGGALPDNFQVAKDVPAALKTKLDALVRKYPERKGLKRFPGMSLDEMEHLEAETGYVPDELKYGISEDILKFNPITSAHAIDLQKQQPSDLDCATYKPHPEGGGDTVIHGRYGDLGQDVAATVPLEYLPLLRPAAQGVAALRTILTKTQRNKGTILVFGASTVPGLTVSQIASHAGHAVVAVVGAEHSGNDLMMKTVKNLVNEPGTAVSEQYCLAKKNFATLVESISTGDHFLGAVSRNPRCNATTMASDFAKLLDSYAEQYPDTLPAAVDSQNFEFQDTYLEREREMFEINMAAYYEQFPQGSPPVEKQLLDSKLNAEQYDIFKKKFWKQTSALITGYGDAKQFNPPTILVNQLKLTDPEKPDKIFNNNVEPIVEELGIDVVPYHFNILDANAAPPGTQLPPGGPVLGAILCVTPNLKIAAEAVAKAKTTRGKAEALQFLTDMQRGTYLAARSIIQNTPPGAPILCVGGTLPELTAVGEPTDADVKEALEAMGVDDNGVTKVNLFVQAFRANDFPFYGEFAVHRALEPLAGPRQHVVTKYDGRYEQHDKAKAARAEMPELLDCLESYMHGKFSEKL